MSRTSSTWADDSSRANAAAQCGTKLSVSARRRVGPAGKTGEVHGLGIVRYRPRSGIGGGPVKAVPAAESRVAAVARNRDGSAIVPSRWRFRFAATVLAAVLGASAAAAQDNRSDFTEDGMKIRILVGGTELAATLENNATSRDFATRLPLELTLEDYHGTEKIADLTPRLSTDGAPEGVDPEIGDITYFAPWGNLALFYRDFGYSRGLVRLGRIEGSVEVLERQGPLTARIERLDRPD